MNGWVKLHRELLDKAIWLNSTPEQKTILITLLLMANHEANQWDWGGDKFDVLPGQFVTSLDSIQKRAGDGISRQNIRTALVRFQKLGFLTYKSTKHGRIITIINWSSYQSQETSPNIVANNRVTKGSQRGNKGLTPNKNVKNVKNEKKEKKKKQILDQFDVFWKAYPRKVAKKKALEAWTKAAEEKDFPGLDAILEAIEQQKKSDQWTRDGGKFIPYPTTWLSQGRWADQVVPPANQSFEEKDYGKGGLLSELL